MAALTATIKTMVSGRPKAWTKPQYGQPIAIKPSDLTPLGEAGGRRWYSWKGNELRENPRRYRDAEYIANGTPGEADILARQADPLPDGPFTSEMTADGERVYVAYSVLAPGTFASLGVRRGVAVPRVKRSTVLDGFDRFDFLLKGARGYAPIMAKLGKGEDRYEVRLSTDGESLVTRGPRRGPLILELLGEDAAGPMLRAGLSGSQLMCTVREHGGKKGQPEAVTRAVGGAWACAECVRS
jgi:hypothetical protein